MVLNELHLPDHIFCADPFQLPLPHHMQRLNALQRPLGCIKRAEALTRSPTLDEGLEIAAEMSESKSAADALLASCMRYSDQW